MEIDYIRQDPKTRIEVSDEGSGKIFPQGQYPQNS